MIMSKEKVTDMKLYNIVPGGYIDKEGKFQLTHFALVPPESNIKDKPKVSDSKK